MSTGVSIAFWAMAVVAVVSALGVITIKDLFRAALFLVVTFLSIAGLFVTLSADFLAAVQVLIYAGAISILLVFAIMLTREVHRGNTWSRYSAPAMFLGGLLIVTLSVVFLNTNWVQSGAPPAEPTTALLGDVLFNRFVLPFEVASVLLLAAIVGAIALVRGKDNGGS